MRSPAWPHGNPLLVCPHCAGVIRVDAWLAHGALRETAADGVEIRLIRGAPEWAAIYAVQGFERVTRYLCTACDSVVAALAHDED